MEGVYPTTRAVTILSGATTSDALNMEGEQLVAIEIPGAFTGTAITFTVATQGADYNAVYDTLGVQYSVTVAANRYIPIPPYIFCGVKYIKLVSGSSEGGNRTIYVITRPV